MSGNYVERLLDRIESSASKSLIFAGVLDNNAKLLSFRKGSAQFSLPIERHDTLDVQLSLMFSLIRQLEDISGEHKFSATRFAKHDVFLFGTSDLHVFAITIPTAEAQNSKLMADIAATIDESNSQVATPALVGGINEHAAGVTMSSTIQHLEPTVDVQKYSMYRPEAISMLQGYLMALEKGITIQDEQAGYYKIKSDESGIIGWSTLEGVRSAFKEKIILHNIGRDADGKIFVRISLK